jgi:superoxide oxidase
LTLIRENTMSANNTNNSYGWVSKTFHWGMLIIIVGQFWLGNNFKDLKLAGLHFSVGLLILFLIIARFIWRAKNPVPELPEGTGKLQSMAAHGLHILFYALLVALPLAGIAIVQSKGGTVSFFGLFSIPTILAKAEPAAELASTMHIIFARATFFAVILHFTMAMYHHFVKKDNVLKRMLPGG